MAGPAPPTGRAGRCPAKNSTRGQVAAGFLYAGSVPYAATARLSCGTVVAVRQEAVAPARRLTEGGHVVNLLLVDSSKVFRMGMRALLEGSEPPIPVVAECADAVSACDRVAAGGIDLVVTDLHLLDRNGLLLTRDLRRQSPTVKVMLLAVQAPEAIVHQAIAAGATGYALKWQAPDEIVDAIRRVAAGGTAMPRGWRAESEEATAVGRPARGPQTLERLSQREREIFDLVVWGYSNKQIAERLSISIKTVETHRGHINGKLRVHTSADMVRVASLLGVLTPGGASAVGALAALRDARGADEVGAA